MKVHLKKLAEQTIVITGASSGIGLVTARLASRCGARLVLAARSGESLQQLKREIETAGGRCAVVVADVGKQEDIYRIAQTAQENFQGFDTWINNAGVSMYGNLDQVSIEDMRRLFETNFWGVVYGSLEAIKHLKKSGGALLNVGSTLSDRAIPLQGIYCASKHAVKGFTDSLRMELEAEGAPISVTLIKPAAIDTPYTEHAKNYLNVKPQNPPPVYTPETVARAILHCASQPERDVFVGAGGKGISAIGYYAPRLTDRYMERTLIKQQKSHHPRLPDEPNGLHSAAGQLKERGGYEGHVAKSSLYTAASLHPLAAGAAIVSLGLAAASLLSKPGNGKHRS